MGLRILAVSFDFLSVFLTDGFRAVTVSNGLPPQTVVKSVGYDPVGRINILMESPAWPDTKDGEPILEVKPTLTRHA